MAIYYYQYKSANGWTTKISTNKEKLKQNRAMMGKDFKTTQIYKKDSSIVSMKTVHEPTLS